MDLDRLINRHKDAVYRQMIRTCGNRDDAEDALADALIAAFKASDKLRDPANFQAWLARIGTRSCARMRIRERLIKFTSIADLEAKGIEIPSSTPGPDIQAELAKMKSCVTGAVEALPEVYREIYLRREIIGDKAEEVAKDLGLSIPALKSRLHRARQLMRESLDSGLGCKSLADSIE